MTLEISLRINGIPLSRLLWRKHRLINGYPVGEPEFAIDSDFGILTLTDDFAIEISESEGEWQPITISELLARLEAMEVSK